MSGFPAKSGGGSGTITTVTSTDLTVTNPGGPSTNVDGPLKANLAAGGFKITGLANGSAASDSAAFGQITAANASALPLAGGTMSGAIAMGTNAVMGLSNDTYTVATPSVAAGAVTILAATNRINNITVSATTAITMSTSGAADGMLVIVRILDGGSAKTLSWVNTENSTVSAPLISNASTTLPLTVGFQYNGATSLWRCIASA